MTQIYASTTPKNVYTDPDVTLAANTVVHIQNKSPRNLMIFAGDAEPASRSDYFVMEGYAWHTYVGAVIYVWADSGQHPLMVQEIV